MGFMGFGVQRYRSQPIDLFIEKSLEAAFRRTELQSQKDGVTGGSVSRRIFFGREFPAKSRKTQFNVFFFGGEFPNVLRIFLVFLTSSRHNFCACRVRCVLMDLFCNGFCAQTRYLLKQMG